MDDISWTCDISEKIFKYSKHYMEMSLDASYCHLCAILLRSSISSQLSIPKPSLEIYQITSFPLYTFVIIVPHIKYIHNSTSDKMLSLSIYVWLTHTNPRKLHHNRGYLSVSYTILPARMHDVTSNILLFVLVLEKN